MHIAWGSNLGFHGFAYSNTVSDNRHILSNDRQKARSTFEWILQVCKHLLANMARYWQQESYVQDSQISTGQRLFEYWHGKAYGALFWRDWPLRRLGGPHVTLGPSEVTPRSSPRWPTKGPKMDSLYRTFVVSWREDGQSVHWTTYLRHFTTLFITDQLRCFDIGKGVGKYKGGWDDNPCACHTATPDTTDQHWPRSVDRDPSTWPRPRV